jgi:hypothetical protein
MTYKKIYSYEDFDNFCEEYIKFITNTPDKIDEQKYKEILYSILEKVTGVKRCLGVYTSGKNKDKRCHATQHMNSKYCLNHKNQDLKSMQISEKDPEFVEKAVGFFKDETEELLDADPKFLLELFRKSKLDDQ